MAHPSQATRPAATRAPASYKMSELTPAERKLLQDLQRERRVVKPRNEAPAPRLAVEIPSSYGAGARPRVLAHAPGDEAAAQDPPPPVVPAQPTEVRAFTPADGAIVGGQVVIRAAIAGNPTRVVCQLDGQTLGVTSGPAPVFPCNSRAWRNGPHQVVLSASGPGGATQVQFTLNVMNR
ncbi:MAG: hypothetical protein VKP62_05720 [Candidatus Sericytochromatia bacterium]|nr:hypothetical protein [Candidatus Sericytochromatia bacterium]